MHRREGRQRVAGSARLPVPLHKGILPKERIFRCARVGFSNVVDRPSTFRGSSRALVAAIAQARVLLVIGLRSCVHNFQRIGASAPHTKRARLQHSLGCVFWRTRTVFTIRRNGVHDQSEYAAWNPDTPGYRVRSPLVRKLLPCRRAYPGGSVELR